MPLARKGSSVSTFSRPTGPCLRAISAMRSEEHTSELQSPCKLVCRLLLEKKKLHLLIRLKAALQHMFYGMPMFHDKMILFLILLLLLYFIAEPRILNRFILL